MKPCWPVILFLVASSADAQQLATAGDEPAAIFRLEPYVGHHGLSAGYSNWREFGLRASREVPEHLLRLELASTDRFDERGVFVGVGGVRQFNPDWYGALSVGAGDGASYLPRFRIDGAISRKFLAGRNLVGSLGAGYYRAPDGHVDRALTLGGIYYFNVPVVLQAEVRLNESDPGNVATYRRAVAVTWGRSGTTQLVGRHAWGGEGYQALGAGASLVNFNSRESSAAVRHWLTPEWGVALLVERYSNPIYSRRGATVTLFREFK